MDEIKTQSDSYWCQLPAVIRYHIIKAYLGLSDMHQMALSYRQAAQDIDTSLRQMATDEDQLAALRLPIYTEICSAFKALPDHWEASFKDNMSEDGTSQLALVILFRGSVKWLAIYLDQLAHQRKHAEQRTWTPYIDQWTPWDWISIAAAYGRTDHLNYLLFRWQINQLDKGRYQFTLPYISMLDTLDEESYYIATPLQIATFKNKLPAVDTLLQYGHADTRYLSRGNTSLVIAVGFDFSALVEKLDKQGADPNRLFSFDTYSAYQQSILMNRVEAVCYFARSKKLCIWQQTTRHQAPHDLINAEEMNPELVAQVTPPIPYQKRYSYALFSALIGICLAPVLVFAMTLHAVKFMFTDMLMIGFNNYGLKGCLLIPLFLLALPIICMINFSGIPIFGAVTGFRMGWHYQKKTVFDTACYSRNMAKTLSGVIKSIRVLSPEIGYYLYVTNAPEYYYVSLGAIITGTFTLLAVLNVFSPLPLIFPALNTWTAWHAIGLTAAASVVVAYTLCLIHHVMLEEIIPSLSGQKSLRRKQPDTLLDEKTLYERLHRTKKQHTDRDDAQDTTYHRSVSVFDQAPVLKQDAKGELVQLGQLTI